MIKGYTVECLTERLTEDKMKITKQEKNGNLLRLIGKKDKILKQSLFLYV